MKSLVIMFSDFRFQAQETADKNDLYRVWLSNAERTIAYEAPVQEALYGMNPKSPLDHFDCLIPRIIDFEM